MDTTAQPIMTLIEVADYLRIPKASIYKLAQQGRIPCQKVGKHWRFRREAINNWLVSGSGNPASRRAYEDA
jgi:excisionase family DNA binding protein